MTHSEFYFKSNADSLKLYTQAWCVPSPKAVVFICHGYMEHCGRYAKLAKKFNELEISVYTMDHRSHGKSSDERKRGYFSKFATVVADWKEYVDRVRSEVGDKIPFFILGHSMGGLITTTYMLNHGHEKSWAGIVLSSPFFQPYDLPNCAEVHGAKCVASIFPTLGVAEIKATTITRDPTELSLYEKDPLNTRAKVTAGVAAQFMTAHEINKRFPEFKYPVLVVHGTEDKLVHPDGSELFYNTANSKDLKYSKYKGGYHELFNEIPETQEKVIKEVMDWVTERIRS
eukprot:TRINITY_DN3922_c0_g1_i3.p1 TRINITY_DN3922_c0_g1~~TRINITY_DN3922_c0_g1_i3.p1  ORF type:complete len:301 (+),score=44.98 TRINITY_DN3922_c0_g1_i3:46-903(+)